MKANRSLRLPRPCKPQNRLPAIEGSTSTTTDGDVTSSTADVAENLFPDIDVVEVSTGASLNLKQELSGGDRPVLLWFWAPH